jgi:hypothetical protein
MVAVAFMPRKTEPRMITRRRATPEGRGIHKRYDQPSLRDDSFDPFRLPGVETPGYLRRVALHRERPAASAVAAHSEGHWLPILLVGAIVAHPADCWLVF